MEAARRADQKRIAGLDTLEAGQALAMLRAIISNAPTLDEANKAISRLALQLDQSRPSLRRRVVELLRYTARTEPQPAAAVLVQVAQVIDDRRRERAAR